MMQTIFDGMCLLALMSAGTVLLLGAGEIVYWLFEHAYAALAKSRVFSPGETVRRVRRRRSNAIEQLHATPARFTTAIF